MKCAALRTSLIVVVCAAGWSAVTQAESLEAEAAPMENQAPSTTTTTTSTTTTSATATTPALEDQAQTFAHIVGNYQLAIDRMEAERGAFDPELSETLFGLGKTYEQAGFKPEALEIYKRSLHVSRVNNGLYSLAQEPMLRGMISIYQDQKNWVDATANYNRLYSLYAKTYGEDDPRILPILDEMNQWHLNAYKNRKEHGLDHLFSSYALSNSAVELVSKHFGPEDLKLVGLLKTLVTTNYYLALHQNDYKEPEPGITFGEQPSVTHQSREEVIIGRSYDTGKKAYQRIIEVLHNNPNASLEDQAEAYAELGDWFMLFGKRESSSNAYQQALALLDSKPEAAASKEKLFGSPKLLPAFPNLYEEDTVDAEGHVRVKLVVTDKGLPREIDILEIVPEDKAGLGYKAKRSVRGFRFRPRFVDNEPVDSELIITLNNE